MLAGARCRMQRWVGMVGRACPPMRSSGRVGRLPVRGRRPLARAAAVVSVSVVLAAAVLPASAHASSSAGAARSRAESAFAARSGSACNPGSNTSALHIFAVTLRCIFSGEVFDDPGLKLKSRCIASVGFDALTGLIPAGKVKLLRDAAGPIGRSGKTLASDLAKTELFDKRLIDGLDNLGQAATLVTHDPKSVVELFLTSDRGLKAIGARLGTRHPAAIEHLHQLQGLLKNLFLALTGIGDVEKCRAALSALPTPAPSTSPVLGSGSLYPSGVGYGQAEPSKIFFGGDPTSLVDQISWTGWGSSQATGQGIGDYVWPGESVAAGSTSAPTELVAWDLGTCNGRLAYQKIDWFFPQYGQTFNPDQWMNICTGAYSAAPSPQACGDVSIQAPPGYATNVQATGVDCSTALSIVANSPAVNYLYQGESRFQTAGLNCGTQGFSSDLGPPTLFECAWGSEDILFDVTDASP